MKQQILNMDANEGQQSRAKSEELISRAQISMTGKFRKQDKHQYLLPVCTQNFSLMVSQRTFFIDKTMFIQFIVGHSCKSFRITRPRRFGKSTALSMLKCFLQKKIDDLTGKEIANQCRVIFCGGEFKTYRKIKKLPPLKIAKNNEEFINKHQGAYPVIYLDLKEINPSNLEQFIKSWSSKIKELCGHSFYYLKAYFQERNDTSSLQQFQIFLAGKADQRELIRSLHLLATWLSQFHKAQVVILIDEFDHPISHMVVEGWDMKERRKVQDYFSSIFSSVLQRDNTYLFKAVLIGIKDVFSAEDSLNISKVLNVSESEGFSLFGFTYSQIKELVEKALKWKFQEQYQDDIKFQLTEIMNRIQDQYNGYEVDGCETTVYNPLAVMQYLSKCFRGKIIYRPEPFWTNTYSDFFFNEAISKMDPLLLLKIQQLINKPKVGVYFQFQPNLDYWIIDLSQPIPEDQLSYVLLQTGYLTGSSLKHQRQLIAKITNNQILNRLSCLTLISVYGSFVSKLPKLKQLSVYNLRQLKLEEVGSLTSILNFILQNSHQEDKWLPNQFHFACLFYSFLYYNMRHYLQIEMKIQYRGQLDHIFYPSRSAGSKCVIIHSYKYHYSGQNEKHLCKDALWQIYSTNYMRHALTDEKENSYDYVLVRGIVFCNNKSKFKLDSLVSREQFHPIQQAEGICLFFNHLSLKEWNRAEKLFQREYFQNTSTGAMQRVIYKMFYQEEEKLTLQKYNTYQRQLLEVIFKKVISGRNLKIEFLESEKNKKEEEERQQQPQFLEKNRTPQNFDYQQVGKNISGFIGQNWKGTENLTAVNFRYRFKDGSSLYNITVEQIMAIEGISEEYAKGIFKDIQKMKKDNYYYMDLPRKRR